MKTCAFCHTEPPAHRNTVYCAFCDKRLSRIRARFQYAGKTFRMRQMHRPWKHWRRTPELDALYLDPVEVAA